MKRTLVFVSMVAAGWLAMPAGAAAHHGDAGRYNEETIEVTGVVVEAQMVNPHALLVIEVTDATGKKLRWQAEFGSAMQLRRDGVDLAFKPGTRVTLTGRAMKSGAPYLNMTERARVVVADTGREVFRTANYRDPKSPATQ